ncbi:hypothetical protein AQUCO_00100308v1 [Aquilegia coerulea]|uniref:Thioredoxin domain-containing protein n=1 Tax=Aquilegia coerulea TaxID=218851 RepID=A0A2G5FA07_AQUCA|nr:hypothetical protein AQUCO_00100308v1 [Aquilegia coerulea]
MEKSKNPLDWINLMVSEPFYFFHFLAFFSYFVVRISSSHILSSEFATHLLHRELQAFLALLVLFAVKLVREETWEGFVADTLFYGKGFLILVSLVLDYHLALCYAIGFFVIYALTQQPPYQGLGNSSKLTPLQLEVLLTEGNTSRFWLVEFRSSWSSVCIRTSSFFSDLSITYSNKNLSFGIVDLGLFPNVAAKFGVSLGVSMGQLPTYILFEKGMEVARFPEVEFEGKSSHLPIKTSLPAF